MKTNLRDWIICGGNELLHPTKLAYFVKEKIVIKDIKCGASHNIALDINGDIYSWGSNDRGQCGQGTVLPMINEPKMIENIPKLVIDRLGCGYQHSYIRSTDKRHYLFGSNNFGECITYNNETEIITPFRVDQIIKSKCHATKIKEIQLGYFNTIVTVSV